MKLTADNVQKTFDKCIFAHLEEPGQFIRNGIWSATNKEVVRGVTAIASFNLSRIEQHREDITSMLAQLPGEFMHDSQSGGTSFLQGCMSKECHQWGEQEHVEMLFMLGMAASSVTEVLPRAAWLLLPGGMPYYTVHLPQGYKFKE